MLIISVDVERERIFSPEIFALHSFHHRLVLHSKVHQHSYIILLKVSLFLVKLINHWYILCPLICLLTLIILHITFEYYGRDMWRVGAPSFRYWRWGAAILALTCMYKSLLVSLAADLASSVSTSCENPFNPNI